MKYPVLQPLAQYNEVQDVFLGLNKRLRTAPREWADMTNLSPRDFPMFAPREQRGTVATLTAPAGIIERDSLVYVDGDTLYVNSEAVTGLVLLTGEGYTDKQLVSMGAYIIILPDKMYVNTSDLTDYGHIDSTYSFNGDVTLTPARVDGTDQGDASIGTSPPVDPKNGDYWVDTSGVPHTLRQYSAMSETWVEIPSAYTKIALTGISSYFSEDDGVEISGLDFSGSDEVMLAEITDLNGAKVLHEIGDDYIIVSGLLSQVQTLTSANVSVAREMPDMDYVTESENRLWGCKYGIVDGETVNELYACAQGDFKNWTRFAGISTDSYAASVGTDGVFTGAITYLGYPIFFKEGCLHKVYGNMPENYRIETTECRGVQSGSHKSLAIVNEMLLYKGRTDILAYDGSLPVGIGEALGDTAYYAAVAGVYKSRYYISMKDSSNVWSLFMYDTSTRLWFREDATQAYGFAQVDDELYYIDASTKKIMAVFGKAGTKEADISFSAETGIIGFESKDHKYVSRLVIRGKVASGASLTVYFRYDSTGNWESAGTVTGAGLVKSVVLPLRPKRCDHFEMKLAGTGEVRIFSIATIREYGGDG
jgi:hypothetical protein